jgi:hypothetical protein
VSVDVAAHTMRYRGNAHAMAVWCDGCDLPMRYFTAEHDILRHVLAHVELTERDPAMRHVHVYGGAHDGAVLELPAALTELHWCEWDGRGGLVHTYRTVLYQRDGCWTANYAYRTRVASAETPCISKGNPT